MDISGSEHFYCITYFRKLNKFPFLFLTSRILGLISIIKWQIEFLNLMEKASGIPSFWLKRKSVYIPVVELYLSLLNNESLVCKFTTFLIVIILSLELVFISQSVVCNIYILISGKLSLKPDFATYQLCAMGKFINFHDTVKWN